VTRITEQLEELRRRVDFAAKSADRDPDSVKILAVSKKQPIEAIQEALTAGLKDFGENYLQEALHKIPVTDRDAVWHFIGSIQSNKTKAIAEHFSWVHTLTSKKIAERLSAQRPEHLQPLQVCIQLRPTGGDTRSGIDENELQPLAETITALPGLQLRGLMIVPLANLSATETMTEFSRAHKLFDQLRTSGLDLDTLSMGMSADLEAAIMAGSTCIRIGTDLFGPRNYE